jgi:hypothetical protein
MVFGAISLIQMFQLVAGKSLTAKTKFNFFFLKNFAIFDFTSNPGNGFLDVCFPATRTFIFFSQISHAKATIHSAGGDK